MPFADLFDFLFDHTWIFLMSVTVINALILKARSRGIVRDHPELADGYDRLFKGYLLCLNLPWLIVALGDIFGGMRGMPGFIPPVDRGNPFVIAFYSTLLALALLGAWWIFLGDGAIFLVTHKGVLNRDFRSPREVKFAYGLTLIGMIVVLTLFWTGWLG